jgi:Uma2 family endonuclease
MGAALLVSEQEYLTTVYEPDCEYAEGELLERNVGERGHGILQYEFAAFFNGLRKRRRIVRAFIETRVQVAPGKYRVPDVCVYKEPAPRGRIFTTPPFIVIEILLPEDRMSRVRQRIDEFLAFGVAYVWLIDPDAHRADVYTSSRIYEAKDLILRTEDPAIEVPLAEIFQALDD